MSKRTQCITVSKPIEMGCRSLFFQNIFSFKMFLLRHQHRVDKLIQLYGVSSLFELFQMSIYDYLGLNGKKEVFLKYLRMTLG